MGDMGEHFRDLKESRRQERERLGVDCPGCNIKEPKRTPTILMPGQRCKVCGHVDARACSFGILVAECSLLGSRKCLNHPRWASTFKGHRTGLVWCDEHKPNEPLNDHGIEPL